MTAAVDVAVIGAGPAGLAAAGAAAGHGARVLVIDDNPRPGGQYYRHAATPALRAIAARVFPEAEHGRALLDVVRHPTVDYRADALLYGIFDGGILSFVHDGHVHSVRPACTIIAAGATEKPVPFPGWTLPGVMGVGAVQNLLKRDRVLPGRRILVAGSGPLMLLAARNLVRVGGNVLEVVEATRNPGLWRRIPGLLNEPAILARGAGYRATLLLKGVPVRTGQAVIEAQGDARIEEALIAPIDREGRIDRARARRVACDALIAGFGLVPSTEITRLLGCEHVFDPGKGGWVPVRTPDLETTVPGIFAIGDGAGIGGYEKALLEGRLAGLVAAVRLGRVAESRVSTEIRRRRARLGRLMRFRKAVEAIYDPPRTFLGLLADNTVVCRCEEATAQELRTHIRDGLTEANSLKMVTRVSMGRCQGRNCLPTVAALIAETAGCPVERVALPRPRQPLRPTPIGALVAGPGD